MINRPVSLSMLNVVVGALILSIIMLFTGFGLEHHDGRLDEKKEVVVKKSLPITHTAQGEPNKLGTINYEGCQYLVWIAGNRAGMAHRGDCDNVKHRGGVEE